MSTAINNPSTTRILIADDVSDAGLRPLVDSGFDVRKRIGLEPEALRLALRDCEGLIVRSETNVTADLLDHAPQLRVIGRAGVGVDNIDVPAATARGIIVMNAPDGNTITTAEHTIALLIALARFVPQANSSLKSGRWERKRFVGVQLEGKTLGVIGLGRIGTAVARRVRGFGMRTIAYDPFVSPERAIDLEVELGSLDDVFTRADFLSVHAPLTAETRGIVGKEALARMKPGVRIINCARGGLVDEQALFDAIKQGTVAGAALDVLEKEPPDPDNPLLTLDEVIITPHIGASTIEAQEIVALTVAEQMRDYFVKGASRGAVNMSPVGVQELIMLEPYMELANKMGRLHAQLIDDAIDWVHIDFAGPVVDTNAEPVTRVFLAGLLSHVSERVNEVNAFEIARERGIKNQASYLRGDIDPSTTITTRVKTGKGEQKITGTILRSGLSGRITEINGFHLDAVLSAHMLVTHNQDVPGVIGFIGTVLGEHNVNIGQFHLGRRQRGGEAMAIIEIDAPIGEEVLESLRNCKPILSARQVRL